MKNTAQKLILISFVLSFFVAVSAFVYIKSVNSKDVKDNDITVLVAAETIPSRTLIDKKMVKEIKVPDNAVFGEYITDSSKIIGKYTKESIYKNEGFNTNNLLDKEGNELSLKIDSNHRALSLRVTSDSGVSSLVKPGDFVDIITYVAEKKDGIKVIRPDEARIILQNIQLLAVDKELNRVENTNDKASEKVNDAAKAQNTFLVTLAIPTSDVEKLVLAESIGSIKLALRPLKDANTSQTEWTTFEDLVPVNNESPAPPEQENQTVSKPSENNSTTKYTSYTVKRGDNLKLISKKFYGDESKFYLIAEANNIKNNNLILTGEVLKIPEIKK